jgi:exonuclease SbcC
MKAALLKFKYCLGHEELEVKPGKITIIEGKEGTGKTSVLESIQRTFTNKSERPVFVHTSGEKAECYVLLDDGTEIRKIYNKDGKATTSDVRINNTKAAGAESFLKSLISENQLNPISMLGLKDKELNELILSLMPIKVTKEDVREWLGYDLLVNTDLHGLQVCKEIESALFETRAETNKEIKFIDAKINNIKEVLPDGFDPEEWRGTKIADIYQEISNANKINADRAKTTNYLASVGQRKQAILLKKDGDINVIREKIKQLEEQIATISATAESEIKEEEKKVEAGKKWLAENPAIDVKPLEEKIQKVEKMKQYVKEYDDLTIQELEYADKKQEAKELTDKLDYIRTMPTELLKKVEMPIDNLSVDGDGNVLINERPLKNLSGGERIRLIVKLAMASAGDLKMILIDGFEKLSPQAQADFIKEVQGTDFQFIFTKVTDGELKFVDVESDGTRKVIEYKNKY